MGKAGKWILNFLVGKKEDNEKKRKKKKTSSSSSFSDHHENLKLKWSFRKTSTKSSNLLLTHNLSKSVNSIDTIEAMNHVAIAEQRKPPSTVQNAAATTIQSAYRSHLVTSFSFPYFQVLNLVSIFYYTFWFFYFLFVLVLFMINYINHRKYDSSCNYGFETFIHTRMIKNGPSSFNFYNYVSLVFQF